MELYHRNHYIIGQVHWYSLIVENGGRKEQKEKKKTPLQTLNLNYVTL